ncbi:hypothetical protein GF356_04080 [candidate division GN15 bacterium]|nr:hypothetical protein [candidate division GN15 bacterium]
MPTLDPGEIRRKLPVFDRRFFSSGEVISTIGSGAIGGKATGLAFINDVLKEKIDHSRFPGVTITIPTLAVVGTGVFDAFMANNQLHDLAYSDMPDDRIAHAFVNAELPPVMVGDLRALIASVTTPLAVRSSSMLEDAMYEPFAGVYGTKMIPNNQADVDTRFRMLTEAIKFVWASTYFKAAKDYIAMTDKKTEQEKMAVIIQEVVGERYQERYYPHISGVGRSFNFYPTGHADPEDGVIELALGLGKTIVDGGRVYSYSPAYPKSPPPVASARDQVQISQSTFWAVNMGRPPAHDPVKETEYLCQCDLAHAEYDNTLRFVASTYDASSDKVYPGVGRDGPRVINFAPILRLNEVPLNDLVEQILNVSAEALDSPVEIEFAVTLDKQRALPARFGLLQVRPMVVSRDEIELSDEEMSSESVLAASDRVLGNGQLTDIRDIVYVMPDAFEAKHTPAIAAELSTLNRSLVEQKRPYVLIGFGRWGSSDPWLGIPVEWGQINGARVIVEATTPEMNVEMSQGSHFFHNITSFSIPYFAVRHDSRFNIDFDWLAGQEEIARQQFTRHVRTENPVTVKVDGRQSRGVIVR